MFFLPPCLRGYIPLETKTVLLKCNQVFLLTSGSHISHQIRGERFLTVIEISGWGRGLISWTATAFRSQTKNFYWQFVLLICSPRLRETFQLFNPSELLSCKVPPQYQAELSIKFMRIRGMIAKIFVVSTVGNVKQESGSKNWFQSELVE